MDERNDETSPVIKKIQEYLSWEEQNGFSGIVTIRIKGDDLISRSFGFANKKDGIPINQNTVFDIGSLTKQFTGAAILKLEMQNKLKVEDNLNAIFPEIPEDKSGITIHQLLTHTSGIKKSMGYEYHRSTKSEFLEKIFNSKLDTIPGAKYSYSHAGYSLLGAIIEEVSGLSYEEYLNKNLLEPAGINNTGYVLPHWDEDQVAHGYRKCRDWGKPMDLPWASDGPYWNLKANGGLISSSTDLLKWIEAIEGNEILSDEAKIKFFYPHVREGESANSFYSYGWMIAKSTRGTDVIAHDGDTRRFFTDLLRYKTEDVSILVQSNLDKPGNEDISFELAKIIFWPDHEPRVRGSVQVCLDSLPDNRMGEVVGRFLEGIGNGDYQNNSDFIFRNFSQFLQNKHTNEHIFDVLDILKDHYVNPKFRKVVITDYNTMELSLRCGDDAKPKNLYIRIIFDEEDDYLIKMLVFDQKGR